MKNVIKNIFKDESDLNVLIYLLIGCSAVGIKYLSKFHLISALFVAIAVINLLLRFVTLPLARKNMLKNLNLIFISLFVYSFFLNPKLIGLLLIANLLCDTLAKLVRLKIKSFKIKYLPKDLNGTLVFAVSFFLFSLFYMYLFEGVLLKKYIFIFFVNALVFSLLENSFKVWKLPDNFNLSIFGSIFLYISLNLRFRLYSFEMNLIFGIFWCLIPIVLLILLDIINIENAIKYYLFFVPMYTFLGFKLFLFNIFIFISMGVVKKISLYYTPTFKYYHTFIKFDELQEYFFISFIFVVLNFFIALSIMLKMSLLIGLITALLHYFYINLEPYLSKKYYNIKNFKIPQEILLYNSAISVVFLIIGYILGLISLIPMLYGLIIVNLYMTMFILLKSINFNLGSKTLVKYLIPYFSFKIFFLFQLL